MKGLVVLPKRWRVERTFSWLYKYRRLNKDYEFLTQSSESMIYIAMTHLMVRRIAKHEAFRHLLRQANLSRANLVLADLDDANLVEANLSGATLVNAFLPRSNLVEANLRGADLLTADLREANLLNADLRGTNLQGAYLSRADLREVKSSTQEQLSSACIDSTLKIAEELIPTSASTLELFPNSGDGRLSSSNNDRGGLTDGITDPR